MASRSHLVLIHSDNDSIISELSCIAHDINSTWVPAQTLKKYHSLVHQLQNQHCTDHLSDLEKLDVLKKFFFENKQFAPLVSKPKLEKYLLPYILLSRSGPSEILLLLFICMARSLNIQLYVIKHSNKLIVKLVSEGKSSLYDFNNQCRPLSTENILDLINEDCDCTQHLGYDEVITKYLLLIKTQSLRERSFLTLYKIQTYLVNYQPFILNHLVDRARAAYAIGDLVRAAEDIGQYLSFHTDKISNYRFLKLIHKLRKEKFNHKEMEQFTHLDQ